MASAPHGGVGATLNSPFEISRRPGLNLPTSAESQGLVATGSFSFSLVSTSPSPSRRKSAESATASQRSAVRRVSGDKESAESAERARAAELAAASQPAESASASAIFVSGFLRDPALVPGLEESP